MESALTTSKAGFLLNQQASSSTTNPQSKTFDFFYMGGKEGPRFKKDRRIFFFMKKMVDEKDGMKRDTGRVALIPLDAP